MHDEHTQQWRFQPFLCLKHYVDNESCLPVKQKKLNKKKLWPTFSSPCEKKTITYDIGDISGKPNYESTLLT